VEKLGKKAVERLCGYTVILLCVAALFGMTAVAPPWLDIALILVAALIILGTVCLVAKRLFHL